jgi:hypothetical protein
VPEGEELGGDNEWLCPDCYTIADDGEDDTECFDAWNAQGEKS